MKAFVLAAALAALMPAAAAADTVSFAFGYGILPGFNTSLGTLTSVGLSARSVGGFDLRYYSVVPGQTIVYPGGVSTLTFYVTLPQNRFETINATSTLAPANLTFSGTDYQGAEMYRFDANFFFSDPTIVSAFLADTDVAGESRAAFGVQSPVFTPVNGIFGTPVLSAVFSEVTYTYTPFAAAVPEPATWGLMIAGFSLIGATLRVRRRAEANA